MGFTASSPAERRTGARCAKPQSSYANTLSPIQKQMKLIYKLKWIILGTLIIVGGIQFFVNMYQRDIKTLMDFSNSYNNYDIAINELHVSIVEIVPIEEQKIDALQKTADIAYNELNTFASKRISSLIKNDSEFMSLECDIVVFSKKEINTIKMYRIKSKNENIEIGELIKTINGLKNDRTKSYNRFEELVRLAK
jgi:hypothetical protein